MLSIIRLISWKIYWILPGFSGSTVSFIVSFSAISDIISYSNSRLKVKLNSNKSDDLIVSREKVQDFKKWLES